jgi:hypothetical protein
MMKLVWSTANQAFHVQFGDQIIRLENPYGTAPLFFMSFKRAKEWIDSCGLTLNGKGEIK